MDKNEILNSDWCVRRNAAENPNTPADVELFAEAEAKGLEQYNGDCDVFSITRSKVIEIVNEKEEGKPSRVRGRAPYGSRNCGEK